MGNQTVEIAGHPAGRHTLKELEMTNVVGGVDDDLSRVIHKVTAPRGGGDGRRECDTRGSLGDIHLGDGPSLLAR